MTIRRNDFHVYPSSTGKVWTWEVTCGETRELLAAGGRFTSREACLAVVDRFRFANLQTTLTIGAGEQDANTAAVGRPMPAEAACGCSGYTRCSIHEASKMRGCLCNGPYASSDCAVPEHQQAASQHPEADPALLG